MNTIATADYPDDGPIKRHEVALLTLVECTMRLNARGKRVTPQALAGSATGFSNRHFGTRLHRDAWIPAAYEFLSYRPNPRLIAEFAPI